MTNAHHAILDYTARHRLKDTPRTTCVACIVQDNVAYWAHAGDSRLYLIRDGRVISQTKDHSRIRLLVEEGMITEAQAVFHPDRNKIYSCLGSPHPPEIEFSRKTPLDHGDNLSVVAVRWEDAYVETPSSAISTQTMSQDEVTTRLDEFGRNPSYKSDLSDDEIEKAIDEIRSAIDKYNPNNPKK